MRTKLITGVALVFCTVGLFAQSTEKKSSEKNKVKIHIEKEVDGKKTVIDTTFTSTDDMAYKTFMDEHEMKVEIEEGKGKDGKTIKKEVIVKYDNKKGDEEKKMILISPDGPVPPLPPMPPTPPGADEELASFNFSWVDDEGVERNDDGSRNKVIKIRKMRDDKELEWNMEEIDKYIENSQPSKKMRKSKRAKKRIIIIEEY